MGDYNTLRCRFASAQCNNCVSVGFCLSLAWVYVDTGQWLMYWRWDDDLIVQRTSQDCGDTISPLSDHRTLPGFHVLTYAQILCILQWEASLCLQCWYCWLVGGKRLLTCKIHECMLVVIWLELWLQFRIASLWFIAAAKSRMVWHSGTSLSRLSWNTDC